MVIELPEGRLQSARRTASRARPIERGEKMELMTSEVEAAFEASSAAARAWRICACDRAPWKICSGADRTGAARMMRRFWAVLIGRNKEFLRDRGRWVEPTVPVLRGVRHGLRFFGQRPGCVQGRRRRRDLRCRLGFAATKHLKFVPFGRREPPALGSFGIIGSTCSFRRACR